MMPNDNAIVGGSSNSDNGNRPRRSYRFRSLGAGDSGSGTTAGSAAQSGASRSRAASSTVMPADDQSEAFVLESGESLLDQEPGFQTELTTSNVAGLLLLLPLLPSKNSYTDEESAEEVMWKRKTICV